MTDALGVSAPRNQPHAVTSPKKDEIRETAENFEAMFLGVFVNEMMKDTAPQTMGGGHGEEMFRSMLGNEIGASMSRAGGVGIADSVERAMRAYRK